MVYIKMRRGRKGGDDIPRKATSAKELFFQWCEVTTCAGVIDCLLARSIVGKLFWALLVIAGLSLTIWHMHMQIKDFLDGEKFVTSVSVVANRSVPFPMVTVCNFNRIDKNLAKSLNPNGLKYIFSTVPNDEVLLWRTKSTPHIVPSYKQDFLTMMKENNISHVGQLFRLYGYSCENTFITCVWNLEPFDCCKNAKEIVNDYGRCWTIHAHNNDQTIDKYLYQNFAGTYYGLKLVLNPNVDQCPDDSISTEVFTEGMMVIPHYYSGVSFNDFLVLPSGSRAWIKLIPSLNKYVISSPALFRLPCRVNATLTYYDAEYSKENCDIDCWANALYQMFNCVTVGPVRKQYKICSPEQVEDYYTFPRLAKFEHVNNAFKTCQQNCIYPCTDYWQVVSSATMAKYVEPSRCEGYRLKEFNGTGKKTLGSMITASIYFASLEYNLIVTSERNPLFNFISDIGGQLSLWLGISIVTIIQVVYYIISTVKHQIINWFSHFD